MIYTDEESYATVLVVFALFRCFLVKLAVVRLIPNSPLNVHLTIFSPYGFHPTSYRNFRTFTVPTRQVQFASLAVDGPGSLVAAGSVDTFEAFVWSIQTGILLAVLSGHIAPISAITFNPDISGYTLEMASVSWDKTLRLWDLTGNTADEHNPSSLGNTKEIVNFLHDGKLVNS